MPLDERLGEIGLHIVSREVGSGGSATVHKAVVESERLAGLAVGSFVAVKEYKPTILTIEGQLERIRQEAEIGLRINHKNLARAYGLLDPDPNDPTSGHVLLLQWIDGVTLEQWYANAPKPVAWETVKSLALAILDGLEALHSQGVWHRDLKPENVMVDGNGNAVVMDIGVCELTSDAVHTLHTPLKDFVGSTRFASPQFILGEPFVQADDIYSLSTVYYLLFTGKQVFHQIVRKPVIPIYVVTESPRVDSLAQHIPASMRLLLQAGLHRERSRRPSILEVRESLTKPEDASFLSRELDRQSAESRGYAILDVVRDGASFFADMAGDEPEIDREYTVVRRHGKKVKLKSYNREVAPEQWVARVVLKHVYQNVGHFVTLGKRWQEGRPGRSPFAGLLGTFDQGTPGGWVEYEKMTDQIKPGDVVLKRN